MGACLLSDERHSWFGFLGSARHQKYTFPLKQTEPRRSPFILFCLEHTYTLRKHIQTVLGQSQAFSSFFAALYVLLYLLLGDIRPRIERNTHKAAKKKKHTRSMVALAIGPAPWPGPAKKKEAERR